MKHKYPFFQLIINTTIHIQKNKTLDFFSFHKYGRYLTITPREIPAPKF